MQHRSVELKAFLSTLHKCLTDRLSFDDKARVVIEKILQALLTEQPASSQESAWQPTCSLLDDAIGHIASRVLESSQESSEVINATLLEHAQALQALSPQLAWWRRSDADQYDKAFSEGHANAIVIGQGGLEERDDVCVGISLLAPGVQYPEHHHPPEEVYLVLSEGQWQKRGCAWFEPGMGGIVHNPPDILHAMRSGAVPLLATWCLWKGHE